MTETGKQTESNALYRYMCDNIVGSKEYVKTIRMMNTVRDNLQSGKGLTPITSGSFGEGLVMKGSDLDLMQVIKCIEVYEDAAFRCEHEKVYFIMQTEDTQPGFTQLRLVYPYDQDILKLCEKIGYDYYFSSVLFKQHYADNTLPTVHGPCLSDERGILDLAYCLHSKFWVTPALQWITRSNNSWPMCEVKQTILKHGVLFVPIGVKGSTHEDLEWRISFSVGEKLLIFTFTHTQLLCYALMKILLKDIISSDLNVSELLCSYFMNTVMFGISEELPPSIWKPENLISCFMRCFRRLIYYVKFSVCPHYFIPSKNLFENKIKGQVQEILLNKLNSLESYGWQCISFSKQISNLDTLAYDIVKESRFSQVCSAKALVCPMMQLAVNLTSNTNLTLAKVIHGMLSTKSSKIKSLYTYYISRFCQQLLQFDDILDNKSTHKQYNTCISTLLRGTRHDAVSGWLLLASFFYKTKEYKKTVNIIQYCLLKCTPEKLYKGKKLSHFYEQLFNLHLFGEMTIVQFLKFFYVDSVMFSSNCVLVPDEIRMEGKEENDHVITGIVFAYFLRFLCHYHLHNTRQCLDSLRNLQLTIEGKYLIATANLFDEAISYNMLGIAFQLIGDTESARQAFRQSLEIYPYPNDA